MLFFNLLEAQNDALARQYLEEGAFEKALVYYKKLAEQHPRRYDFLENLIHCYQQLEDYKSVENILLREIDKPSFYPTFFVELGYNYQLQKKQKEAQVYYEKALSRIDNHIGYTDPVGVKFQKYNLLEYAIEAYQRGEKANPMANYSFQLARIYGEKGDMENMFASYLRLLEANRASKINVLRYIGQFITHDSENENNLLLKKILLKKVQTHPDVLWNEVLSWLFVQQEQYYSAFLQEKAVFKRTENPTLHSIIELGELCFINKQQETAKTIFEFILENTTHPEVQLLAQMRLIELELSVLNSKNIEKANTAYKTLINSFGVTPQTIDLQVTYAKFLAFVYNDAPSAILFLREAIAVPQDVFNTTKLKMALADILVYNEHFNEALLYYSQIQKSLKNHILSQEARFKVAQTSFYKGDFNWATIQLKVLRESTSQLIANDAMQLSLLISDNTLQDSTQTALKKYAKAHLLAYQNKKKEAITVLDDILIHHKGEKIEDEALFKQAQLLEIEKEYSKAEHNYLKILEFYADDILVDDTLFALAKLYKDYYNNKENAMKYFEQLIFKHPGSIYFVEAQKNYRHLRGDIVN